MENFTPGDLLNEAATQMGETFKEEVCDFRLWVGLGCEELSCMIEDVVFFK